MKYKGDESAVKGYIDARLAKLRALEEAIEGLDLDLQQAIEAETRRISEAERQKQEEAQQRREEADEIRATIEHEQAQDVRRQRLSEKALERAPIEAAEKFPFSESLGTFTADALDTRLRHFLAEQQKRFISRVNEKALENALAAGAEAANLPRPLVDLQQEVRHLQVELKRLSGDMYRSVEYQNQLSRRLVKLENRPANPGPSNDQMLHITDRVVQVILSRLMDVLTSLDVKKEK